MKKKILKMDRDVQKEFHQLLELWHGEQSILDLRVMGIDRLERGALEIKALFPNSDKAVKAADAILRDVQEVSRLHGEIRFKLSMWRELTTTPNIDDELDEIQTCTVSASMRFVLIMRKIGWPRNKNGKGAYPEWPFIGQAWRSALKKSQKPNRPDVIEDGLRRFREATGKPSDKQWPTFMPHFKEQVIDKKSR